MLAHDDVSKGGGGGIALFLRNLITILHKPFNLNFTHALIARLCKSLTYAKRNWGQGTVSIHQGSLAAKIQDLERLALSKSRLRLFQSIHAFFSPQMSLKLESKMRLLLT